MEARFGGLGKWFPAKIINARGEGRFDVLYDDGDTETWVKRDMMRYKGSVKRESGGDVAPRLGLSVGDSVETRFFTGARDTWVAGKITNARSNGTYDIQFPDGEKELRVKKNMIRKK